MVSAFSKAIGSVLVPLLGYIVCPPAVAQDVLDESIEILDTIEVPATYDTQDPQEEREIHIPPPDASAFMPLSSLMVATIPKTLFVPETRLTLARDAIADRKGLWKTVRTIIPVERHISLSEPEVTTLAPVNGLMVAVVSTPHPVSPNGPDGAKLARDSIADRKGLRKTVRLIKSDRPLYPKTARKNGWEGTVVLRLTIDSGGSVGTIITRKSSGFPSLDESAIRSVKTWRFDPAKDGEFPVSSAVDLPIRFDLEEYNSERR